MTGNLPVALILAALLVYTLAKGAVDQQRRARRAARLRRLLEG